MEYQHLVFEEFARKIQPGLNVFDPFAFSQTDGPLLRLAAVGGTTLVSTLVAVLGLVLATAWWSLRRRRSGRAAGAVRVLVAIPVASLAVPLDVRGRFAAPSLVLSRSASNNDSARSKIAAGSPSGTECRTRSCTRRSFSYVSFPTVNCTL